jgi:hypothetical protein
MLIRYKRPAPEYAVILVGCNAAFKRAVQIIKAQASFASDLTQRRIFSQKQGHRTNAAVENVAAGFGQCAIVNAWPFVDVLQFGRYRMTIESQRAKSDRFHTSSRRV